MSKRLGCLILLVVWALLGLLLHLTDSFGEDGGGRFALLGLIALLTGLSLDTLLTRLHLHRKPEPRGFPLEPHRPDPAPEDV